MRKEYDLINELGPRNWLDTVAGEAVFLGYQLRTPELSAKGTALAKLIREIRFDDDAFFVVQCTGIALQEEIAQVKKKVKETVFIDDIYTGKEKKEALLDWEYDLIMVDGRYQIQMILPVYYDKAILNDERKQRSEKWVRSKLGEICLENCRVEEVLTQYESQIFTYTKYFDEKENMRYETVDFNHEGSPARGWMEYFFFDDWNQACEAWSGIKEVYFRSKEIRL
ncbi:MAG TPA: hypothetical protein PLI45_04975 [Candidatus Woesebacteria bacterium]|nr:hypothetical protein [Candidatus Woesebacteria bacterium]